MSAPAETRPAARLRLALSWRWVHVAVAALAMAATLPGRTFGLGLITEPLLRDLQIDRVAYGELNFWATLLGAAFCLPCGWLIDRIGIRAVLAATLAGLGAVVLVLSQLRAEGASWELFLLILLTRGLGQSALSVVSLALAAQAGGRRPGLAMGVYSALVAVAFAMSVSVIGAARTQWQADWRSVWAAVGLAEVLFALCSWPLVRPDVSGWGRPAAAAAPDAHAAGSVTLGQAVASPVFWLFALATSFYGLISSGILLYNQSILQEQGFSEVVFFSLTALSFPVGLAGNLTTGWLATRRPLSRLLALALLLLAAALGAFPLVATLPQVYLYAATLAWAGGMITVLFFAVWGQVFGPAHLGKIQGAAQMLTVLASAVGPWLVPRCREWSGSHTLLFEAAAVVSALLMLWAWRAPLPRPRPADVPA
jgi:MFS family permease